MARKANPQTDFLVNVDGVGEFTFGKKGMRDEAAVALEYSRMTQGYPHVTEFLNRLATMIADLVVMTVAAPDGWDVDTLDPEDEADWNKLIAVWSAYRDKAASFRKGSQPGSKAPGA